MDNNTDNTPELEEEELFEHHRHVADKGQSLLRVDKFLMQLIANATRNKIQKAADDGNIWVNDVPLFGVKGKAIDNQKSFRKI